MQSDIIKTIKANLYCKLNKKFWIGKMARNYSYEEKITNGKVAIVREFTVNFDRITVIFENIITKLKKELNFSRVTKLSIQADCHDDYDDSMDMMAYRTLMGFDFEKVKDIYIYTMKIDDYEIIIESLNFITLTDMR
jgi:hypothetical protein